MARRRHRFVWDHLGLTSPAEADRESASPSAARNGVQGDAEAAAVYAGPNGDENVKDESARLEANEPAAGEEQSWSERFSSPEEMWRAFRNEQRVRGRLANLVGDLRALNDELELRLARYEAITIAQIELGKQFAALEADGGNLPLATGLEAVLRLAGESPNGPAVLREENPSSIAEGASTPAPESPEAAP